MSVAIHAENISKVYQLGSVGTGSLSMDFQRWLAKIQGKEDPFFRVGEENIRSSKGVSNVVWSLKDISFKIQQGEAVGIIGKNGAGKSTLLKILSRVTAPTAGTIKIRGRLTSLLEVGTGFHPELTGRENVYLNGAIMGMKKKEIRKKFDEIVDFSGVERYIDTPVKRYSSGMYVRLAFAVAAHLEAEILVVDEVLAVGDIEFQKKCLGKMDEVRKGSGRTVLFVSHQMSSIKNLCRHGFLLKNGRMESSGLIDDVIEKYLHDGNDNRNIKYYDKHLKYVKVEQHQSKLVLTAEYQTDILINQPHLGFVIYNSFNHPIFASNPTLEKLEVIAGEKTKKGKVTVEIESPQLIDGQYHASIWFGDTMENFIEDLDCIYFNISGMTEKNQYSQSVTGSVVPVAKWNFTKYD